MVWDRLGKWELWLFAWIWFVVEKELCSRDLLALVMVLLAAEPRHNLKSVGICIKQTISVSILGDRNMSPKSYTVGYWTTKTCHFFRMFCFMRIFPAYWTVSLPAYNSGSPKAERGFSDQKGHGSLPIHKWLQFPWKVSLVNHRWIFTKNALKGLCCQ